MTAEQRLKTDTTSPKWRSAHVIKQVPKVNHLLRWASHNAHFKALNVDTTDFAATSTEIITVFLGTDHKFN